MNGLNRIEDNMTSNAHNKSPQKHFVFVINTLKAFGGAERQALIFADHLKTNLNHKVSFLAFEEGEYIAEMLQEKNIPYTVFPFKHNAPKHKKAIAYLKLIRLVKKLKPDVLIPYVAESNKIVAELWKTSGAQFAFWNQREEGRKLFGTTREKKLIRGVPAIVSNSFEGRDALVKTYGLLPEQITVINNGVLPKEKPKKQINWHAHFDIDTDRPLICMIANITDRKDHETLIKAWSLVVKHCKSNNKIIPFLVLAGRKDKTYDKLRLLAFDFKLSEHIGFTGALSNVDELIEPCIFAVFSSNLEGCPNGVLECMEQGKAVIGTHISGVEQALGLKYAEQCLVQKNNSTDFAEKIIHLLAQPNLMNEIGQHNAERIKTEFSIEQMVEKHLQLISKTHIN
jgi:glycosyltransferase involved in cell wall biosynthesis